MSEKEKEQTGDEDRDAAATEEGADETEAAAEKAPAKAKIKSDDAESEGEDAESEGEAGDDDASAARIAAALGVEGEVVPDEAAGEGEEAQAEPAGPANRAARRRDEALERRRKRKGLPPKKEGEDVLPRDKNKRAKELLQRRREAAATESAPAQLEAGEMVDDALSRMWASTTKWIRGNLTAIQWVIAAGLIGVAGWVGYTYYTQKNLGVASNLLASGARVESALVLAEDKRSDEDKEVDPTPYFKTAQERDDKALADYREVENKFAGSGAAILAKLGEAGVLLDKREWEPAIAAFEAVLKTPLAGADADVKGRAVEGIALAKEGKGDLDGAMAGYKQLEGIEARGFKELAQYHQARLLLAKGNDADKKTATDLLKTAYDKLKAPSLDTKPSVYLLRAVEQALKTIDPSLVPDKDALGGMRGGQMSPEEVQARLRKIQEELGKKKGDGDGH